MKAIRQPVLVYIKHFAGEAGCVPDSLLGLVFSVSFISFCKENLLDELKPLPEANMAIAKKNTKAAGRSKSQKRSVRSAKPTRKQALTEVVNSGRAKNRGNEKMAKSTFFPVKRK